MYRSYLQLSFYRFIINKKTSHKNTWERGRETHFRKIFFEKYKTRSSMVPRTAVYSSTWCMRRWSIKEDGELSLTNPYSEILLYNMSSLTITSFFFFETTLTAVTVVSPEWKSPGPCPFARYWWSLPPPLQHPPSLHQPVRVTPGVLLLCEIFEYLR